LRCQEVALVVLDLHDQWGFSGDDSVNALDYFNKHTGRGGIREDGKDQAAAVAWRRWK
jgi:hypothetical protein